MRWIYKINGARVVEGLAGKPGEDKADSLLRMGCRNAFGEMAGCAFVVELRAAREISGAFVDFLSTPLREIPDSTSRLLN